jgi:PhnB protein
MTVITPRLRFPATRDALAFYARAFGAVEVMCLTMADGAVAHAEMTVEGARVMLADEDPNGPQSGRASLLHVELDAVDPLWERAVAAGCTVVYALGDKPYGERSGRLRDPFGHEWILTQPIEDLSNDELQRRVEGMG